MNNEMDIAMNYINNILIKDFKFGPVINEIVRRHNIQKTHNPHIYADYPDISKAIKTKYSHKQIQQFTKQIYRYREVRDQLGIMAGWMQNKEIIDLSNVSSDRWFSYIANYPNEIYNILHNFSTETIFKIPYNQFAICVPTPTSKDHTVMELIFIGFTSKATYYINDSKSFCNPRECYNLSMTTIFHSNNEPHELGYLTFYVPLNTTNMYDNIQQGLDDLRQARKINNLSTPEKEINDIKSFITFVILLLLYIIDNNISNHNISSNSKNEPSNHTKDEIRPWDVTARKGETIGPKEISKTTIIDDEEYEFVIDPKTYRDYPETHQPPRPHMRRGHAHNYWCGSGENKHLEERWLKPIEVNHVDRIGPDQMPVVFHDTTDK